MTPLATLAQLAVLGGFLLFLVGYALYSVYATHHLREYGYSGDASQLILRFYIGFTIVVILSTIVVVFLGLVTR